MKGLTIFIFILIAIVVFSVLKIRSTDSKKSIHLSSNQEKSISQHSDNNGQKDKTKTVGKPVTGAYYPHERLQKHPTETPINSDTSFDINQIINRFLGSNYAKAISDSIYIVLDSTCVKQDEMYLKALKAVNFDDRVKLAITKDSYYELKILKNSRIYNKRANILLQMTSKNLLDFSVQDLYRTKDTRPSTTIEYLNQQAAFFFLFNSFASFDEFIKLVYPQQMYYDRKNYDKIFVASLCVNSRYSQEFIDKYLLIQYADFISRNSTTSCLEKNNTKSEYRIVQPIKNKNVDQIEKLSQSIKTIEIFSNDKVLAYDIDESWDNTTGNGGEANIYAHPDKSDECIKIYNNSLPCDNKIRKILWLMNNTEILPNESISLPTGIVYAKKSDITFLNSTSDERICIGYTMKKFCGTTLADAVKEYAIDQDEPLKYQDSTLAPNKEFLCKKKKHLTQIIKLCLELKMVDVYFVDIKLSNIIVDENKDIKFIDCDSYEVGTLPSEGVTGAYTHRDILNLGEQGNSFGAFLKEPRYFDFSLTTLAYRIYMASEAGIFDTPARQGMYSVEELVWNNEEIGFSLPEYPMDKVLKNEYWFVEEGWKYILNQKQRSLFYNTFNYKKIYGMGIIAHEFELDVKD